MRALAFCSLAAVMAMAAVPTDYDSMFLKFKRDQGRIYSSVAEEAYRRKIFIENMQRAEQLQKVNPKATFGPNPYSDVSASEFKKVHHSANFSKAIANHKPIDMTNFPQAGRNIDWRAKGAVTGVKNQKNCGGCYSFSTTGNIEGQWFLAGHELVSLSEQEILSCDLNTGNDGCQGGLMDYAFEWLVDYKNGNIDTEASYPFVSGDGIVPSCTSGHSVGATINGHVDLPKDEDKIADYVYANGPVSIGVDASAFQSYTGGILTSCQDGQLDHAVLIVGFDDDYETPYWIIKNSWGVGWGESGYIRVQKGTDQCGLKKSVSSSTVGKGATSVPGVPNPPAATPVPAVPSPTSSGSFTQKVCTNSACTEGCQSHTLPLGSCLQLNGGGSAKAECGTDKLTLTQYPLSQDCSGFSLPTSEPLNQCGEDQQGTYIENICNNNNDAAKLHTVVRAVRRH